MSAIIELDEAQLATVIYALVQRSQAQDGQIIGLDERIEKQTAALLKRNDETDRAWKAAGETTAELCAMRVERDTEKQRADDLVKQLDDFKSRAPVAFTIPPALDRAILDLLALIDGRSDVSDRVRLAVANVRREMGLS